MVVCWLLLIITSHLTHRQYVNIEFAKTLLEERLVGRDEKVHVTFLKKVLQKYYKTGIPEFLDSGRKCWTLDSGRWTLDPGIWTLHHGLWTLGATLWSLGSGHWIVSLFVSEENQNPVSDSAWLYYWKFFGCESLRTSWSRLFCRNYRFWRDCF